VKDRTNVLALLAALLPALVAGCGRPPKPAAKDYTMHGQVLAVHADSNTLTVHNDDIPGFMPAMTMNYAVADPALMKGRTAGELITATLEVTDVSGKLTAITHTGSAPLPSGSNIAAMAGSLLDVGDPVPDVALIDQNNRRRSLSEWKGTLTVITFIYTRCPLPNYCPLMDHNFVEIQQAVARDPDLRGKVKLISISFDPDHDTLKVLAAHAKSLGADPAVWTFLTGDQMTIDRTAAKFGVGVMRTKGSPYITHNLRTAVIGTDGRILHIYSGNDWKPAAVLAELRAAHQHP
jgi:protein SCO1